VAVLEAHFESCGGLWLLVVAKAKHFIGYSASLPVGVTPADVLRQAQALASAMRNLHLNEKGEIRRDCNEPTEVVFAPVG